MGVIERAKELRAVIEGLVTQYLDDDEALNSVELFPTWDENGHEYKVDDRVKHGGNLYKVLQDHTSQPGWMPEAAPSMFAEVLTSDDGTPLEWKQPDSTNPYMTGDRVLFGGKVYESAIDNNVWSPAEYPQGWKTISGGTA